MLSESEEDINVLDGISYGEFRYQGLGYKLRRGTENLKIEFGQTGNFRGIYYPNEHKIIINVKSILSLSKNRLLIDKQFAMN